MDNLNLEHHVKLRNNFYKKQSEYYTRLNMLRNINLSKLSFIQKRALDIDINYCLDKVAEIQRYIDNQQKIIDTYMNNLQ